MKQLLFILFIISLNTFSQSIDIGNKDNIMKTHFVEENKELFVFYKDSISIIDIQNSNKISKKFINYPIDDFITKFEIISIHSEIYFLELHGGKVYKLDVDEFSRLDKSYTHRMQMGSSSFVHHDTIFKFGGYGFWSIRNFFTYFDIKTSEWDVLSPSGSKSLPKGSQYSTIKIFEDNFYIYGGLTLNQFEPKEYILNNEVWEFNNKNKSWKLLGHSDVDLNTFKYTFPYNEKQVFYNQDDDNIYLVDVVNNSLKTFKKKTFQYGMNTSFKSFYIDGIFYCIISSYNSGSVTLTQRYEDDFFGELIKEEQFYYNNEKVYYSIGFFLLILSLVYLYFRINKWNLKRNRVIIENGHLIFSRKTLNFDEKSIRIINLLLKSEQDIPSKDIMNIVENPNLNYGHNTRVMNGFIEEINLKLKSILRIEKDLITSKKSDLDKRIKVYSIDKTYFFIK